MFCQSCGQKLADDATFCENCGALTPQKPQSPPPPMQQDAPYQQPVQAPYQQAPYRQAPYQQPPQYGYQQPGQPYYPQQPYPMNPVKKKSAGKTVFAVIAVLVVLVLVIVVASSLFGNKDLTNFTTTATVDESTFTALKAATVFAPDTPVIYCTFRSNLPVGTAISTEWAYLGTDPDSVTFDYTTKYSPEQNYFKLPMPESGWPIGKYQVTFYIEGKSYKTVKFEVKNATGAKTTPAAASLISDVQTALEVDSVTLKPISPQSVFATTAPVIYVTFMINNAPVGSPIHVEWIYSTTSESIISSDANTTESSQNANFQLSKPTADWPAGEYEVRISVSGTYVTSAKFTVK